MGQFLDLVDRGIRELNSQFWLLHNSAAATAAKARSLRTLNRISHSQLPDVSFPGVRERGRIRLRDRSCADDLNALSKATARWLPAYFTLLSKSLAESAVLALIENRIANDPIRAGQFRTYRENGPRRPLRRSRALQNITQALCGGDFDVFHSAFPLGAGRSQLKPLARRLRFANLLRNRIAHELAPHTDGTPGRSIKGWQAYTGTARRLVEIAERHL